MRWTAVIFLTALATQAAAYEVGHVSLTFHDPERGGRAVPTEVFYPADAAGESVPVASPPAGGFPAVSFGHGYLMSWDLYDYVWRGLVPQGYIVALPATEQGFLPDHEDLGLDLAFVIRELASESADPGSLFHDSVSDMSAALGHSMGGGASVLAAASDPTVDAVANLAAAETNPSAASAAQSVAVPALLFSGGADCVTPPSQHQTPIYDGLASDCRTHVTLDGASHCQFADYSLACSLGEGACDDPTLSRQEQHDLVVTLLRPWLDYVVKGDVDGWIELTSLLDTTPGVSFEQDCAGTSVEGPVAEAAAAPLLLSLPHPNPTRDGASLSLTLVLPGRVRARVYTPAGRLVATLLDDVVPSGVHHLHWTGVDAAGRPAASGVYFVGVDALGVSRSRMMVLLR